MRASGVLMPVSSIPSEFGIGCFSREAYDFVDQLAAAGLSLSVLFHFCWESIFY